MTEPRRIGVLTIGQAPRADDAVAELSQVLGPSYTILERGALDDLSASEIDELVAFLMTLSDKRPAPP